MSIFSSTKESSCLARFRPLGKNVPILALCQAIGVSGISMALLLGGIIGSELAPSPSRATFPIAALVIGTALFTLPAAQIMKVLGRKRGLVIGSIVASMAALASVWAISIESFFWFCISLLAFGANGAFILQYRFVAAESVEGPYVGRAVSFILIGGIFAGLLGPELGKGGRDLLELGPYTGSFAVMAVLYGFTAALLLSIKEPTVKGDNDGGHERPLWSIVKQPTYLIAVSASTVSYAVMAFIMSATPISMHVMDGFSLEATTLIIQAHMLGMYVPSLFSGFLVDRFALRKLQVIGTIIISIGVVAAASGHGFMNYLLGLVLLGLGWNFLFVSGTVMLTRSYNPKERFKAQGINDFLVFSTQALVILSAGMVLATMGWEFMNMISLPVLGLFLILVATTKKKGVCDGF